ncbi:MAG: tyrosine-type recombinase/integrase [Elusimicrobiota bacterium]
MSRNPQGYTSIINEPSIGQAYEAFELRCEAKGLSPLTCGWYRQILSLFQRFLESQGVTDIRRIDAPLIRSYLCHMRRHGKASGTIARTYGGLRCFFGFLSRERMIPQNPAAILEKPRMERKLIRPLTVDQVRRLLAQPTQTTFMSVRTWTVIILILDTGLRVSEVLGLTLDQVDIHHGLLRVMGKGAKEREVPMGRTCRQALSRYVLRRGKIPDQDLGFVSRFGNRMGRGSLRLAFRRLGREAGLTGVRVSPHTLRHTFATHYIMNGGDVFSLQQILGHSTLDMVRVYVRLANRDVTLQHRRFSPIDNLGGLPGSRKRVVLR